MGVVIAVWLRRCNSGSNCLGHKSTFTKSDRSDCNRAPRRTAPCATLCATPCATPCATTCTTSWVYLARGPVLPTTFPYWAKSNLETCQTSFKGPPLDLFFSSSKNSGDLLSLSAINNIRLHTLDYRSILRLAYDKLLPTVVLEIQPRAGTMYMVDVRVKYAINFRVQKIPLWTAETEEMHIPRAGCRS